MHGSGRKQRWRRSRSGTCPLVLLFCFYYQVVFLIASSRLSKIEVTNLGPDVARLSSSLVFGVRNGRHVSFPRHQSTGVSNADCICLLL